MVAILLGVPKLPKRAQQKGLEVEVDLKCSPESLQQLGGSALLWARGSGVLANENQELLISSDPVLCD